MADENTEITTTDTTTEAPAETTETTSAAAEAPATMEVAKDVETVADESAPASEGDETQAAEDAPDAEPILFDAEIDDTPSVLEKAQKIFDRYDLPEDVQKAFAALTAKANATPAAELAVYGDTDAVKGALDRHDLLFSVDELPDGSFRPKTQQFVAELDAVDPEKNDWLFYDIANTASKVYPKLTRFEENLVNYFGNVGEPVSDVMERARQVKEFMSQGLPQGDMPVFIPKELRQAYFSLEPASRAEIEALESNDEYGEPLFTDADKTRKVRELAQIQRGITADREESQRITRDAQAQRETFNNRVVATQNTVFSGVRDAFAASLRTEVKFSDDPKVQALLCNQQVTMLQQAFLPDSDGEFARKALAEGSIKFDLPKANAIIREIEKASVEVTLIQSQVDENGVQQNTVALNKAAKNLEDATRKFQEFGSDIIRQQKQIVSAGQKETVDKAVTKRKLELKTRPVPQSSTAGVKQQKSSPVKLPDNIRPMSPEADAWYADQEIQRRAAQGGK